MQGSVYCHNTHIRMSGIPSEATGRRDSRMLILTGKGITGITFPLERRSRWAEPGLKGETERRGGSSPCSSSRLGIWESPHLSLDLGESPHPVS